MPRPRTGPALPVTADSEQFSNAPVPAVPEDQSESRRARDPAQEQILRSLPNSLSREMKLAALGWRGGCFCCPANISFAQCISGLWQAARKPAESADALVHWGLNTSKFIFEAGSKGGYGRNLLLRAGFASLVPQLLAFSDEVPQSIALTPQVFFVQIFATGGRQLPLSTTPQLVILGLLALTTLSPANLRAALASAGGGSPLVSAVVRVLASTDDDRMRSLTLQTLTEWVNICQGDPFVDDGDGAEEDGETKGETGADGGGRPGVSLDALVEALLDEGLAPAVVHVLESSSNAAVLRDACAFLLALLGGGMNGGGAAAAPGPDGSGGGHQRGHNKRVAGLTAMELPPDTRLDGRARCRARDALLKAGLVSALLSALARRPSQLRYWAAINMGVSGARHLEMQWLMLLIARICVLRPEHGQPPAAAPAAAADGAECPPVAVAESSPTEVSGGGGAPADRTASDGGRGGASGLAGKREARKGRRRAEDVAAAAAEGERLRLAAVELLLQSAMFAPWLHEPRSVPAGEAPAAGSDAAAAAAVEAPAAVPDAAAAAVEAGAIGPDAAAVAAAVEEEAATVVIDLSTEEEQADGGSECDQAAAVAPADAADVTTVSAAPPVLPADVQAVRLLSRVIAASTLRSCVLPDGVPLEALPPRERNVTPDFRTLQRDRIRRAAEEARAAQALASANSAVEMLSRAVTAM